MDSLALFRYVQQVTVPVPHAITPSRLFYYRYVADSRTIVPPRDFYDALQDSLRFDRGVHRTKSGKVRRGYKGVKLCHPPHRPGDWIPNYISIADAATMCGTTTRPIYSLIEQRRIAHPTVEYASKVFIAVEDIETKIGLPERNDLCRMLDVYLVNSTEDLAPEREKLRHAAMGSVEYWNRAGWWCVRDIMQRLDLSTAWFPIPSKEL